MSHLSINSQPHMTNIRFGFTALLLLTWLAFQYFFVLYLKICSNKLFLGMLDKLESVSVNKF